MYFLHYIPCIESKNIMLREFLAADVQRIIGIRPIRTMLQQVPCPAHWHRLVNQRTCPSDPLGSAYKIQGLIPSNSSGLEKRQALQISVHSFHPFIIWKAIMSKYFANVLHDLLNNYAEENQNEKQWGWTTLKCLTVCFPKVCDPDRLLTFWIAMFKAQGLLL